jgi:dipeptidyl aminopeptidase/acylaminoacyl peptidase
LIALAALVAGLAPTRAEVPENLVLDGVPAVPPELRADAARYLEFRGAAFQGWHPTRREALITTRFADVPQLHLVQAPGGARRQLTFLSEPVRSGAFQPRRGEFIVFARDTGGAEFYQLYRYDLADGRITLLTDGQSRNTGARWSRSGRWLAYTSTRRNGRDTDFYVMDPADPKTDRLLLQVQGGGWNVQDWSWDETQLLVGEFVSINESYLSLVDVRTGQLTPLRERPPAGPPAAAPADPPPQISIRQARLAKDGRSIFMTTDEKSEFRQLVRVELATHSGRPLMEKIRWDIEEFELSPDGRQLAVVANEDGASVLRVLDARSGRVLRQPKLPLGVIAGLEWHPNGRAVGFTFSAARSPSDVFSFEVKTGRLERWTESETGGLDAGQFVEPEIVRFPSFDGRSISALLYRPDPAKFSGPRPVLINIHGGPEAQARPTFLARNNYFLSELGVAVVYPNVRGSDGYGKTFLTLDNGLRREDAVRDIGALLDWLQRDPRVDGARVAVMGGSYGGYMTLASLVHSGDRLRCGVNVVGISSFLTFLKNTQDYRRDLRRAEYGDERDPKMAEFLERISPLTNVRRLTRPLLVVQGRNDPRVPVTEAEQMVRAVRANGGAVWYLLAKDEGHGFQKKKNADFQFLATIQFLREHLLR